MRKSFILTGIFVFSSLFGEIPIPSNIQTPASIETRLGKLEFPLGVPAPKTTETLYNHLDYIHGINSFLTAFSGASSWAMRQGFLKAGVQDNAVLIFSELMDSKSLFLTGDADTLCFFSFLDLSNGPIVLEIPSRTFGFLNDMWFRWLTDTGTTGPDKGIGGKYLIVPPDYQGTLPQEGYFITHARTTRVLCSGKAFLEEKQPKTIADRIKEELNIYSYKQSSMKNSKTRFVEGSGLAINTIPPNDYSCYEMMNALIQDQPAKSLDPEIGGNLAAIGIVKGKVFQPDEELKKTLLASTQHGNGVSRMLVYRPRPSEDFNYYGPNSHWLNHLVVGGYEFLTPPSDVARKLDARTALFYIATGVSPSRVTRPHGAGSQYLASFLDSQSQPLDGAKMYQLRLPANIPAAGLWSLTLYDNQTRSMLMTPQRFPKAGPRRNMNSDGTVVLYFYLAPQQPKNGQPGNWIQTLPGQGYFAILRLYSPLQAFF